LEKNLQFVLILELIYFDSCVELCYIYATFCDRILYYDITI